MAVTTSTCIQACLNLQEGLAAKVPENVNPTTRPIADFGVIKALRDPQNKMGFDSAELNRKFAGKGSLDGQPPNDCKTYELTYLAPDCADADDGFADVCVEGTFTNNQACLDVTVDLYKSVKGTMSREDFNCLCNNPPVGVENYGTVAGNQVYQFRNAAKKIIRSTNTALIDLMGAEVGDFDDGTTGATGKTLCLTNSNGGINLSEWVKINDELRLQRMGQDFIGIGGAAMANWTDRYALQEGCCNDQGQRTGGLPNLYYDLDVDRFYDPTLATSHMIAWVPSSYQVIEWNRNTGDYDYIEGTEISTTIDIDGMTFDLNINYVCGGTITWALGKGSDLFAIPQAAYGACNDGNGRLHYVIDCCDATC